MNDEIVNNDAVDVKKTVEPKRKRDLTEKIPVAEAAKSIHKYRQKIEYLETVVKPMVIKARMNDRKKIKKLTTGLILVSGAFIISLMALILILSNKRKEVN